MVSPTLKRILIAKAHELHPFVIMGEQGLTKAILAETERALYDHELIKVRINAEDRLERQTLAKALSEEVKAECLKIIGHIVILYRPSTKTKDKEKDKKRK